MHGRLLFSVMDFKLAFTGTNDLATQLSIGTDLKTVETIFAFTYPLAHSIATLVGLGPYRRSLVKMVTDFKRKIKAEPIT